MRATRARGTIGGSLANGDPAAEIVLVAVTLGATLVWREGGDDQRMRGGRFLPRPDGDGAAAGRLPRPRRAFRSGRSRGSAWASTRSTRGRATLPSCRPRRRSRSTPDGRCTRAAIGIGAATAVPLRLDAVADALNGQPFDEATVREAVRAALADIEPLADLHASADYRKPRGA